MKRRNTKIAVWAVAAWCVMWGLCAQVAAASTITDADWVSMNTTPSFVYGSVNAIAVDASGTVYAGGNFTSIGGVTVNNIAKWDGASWSALGSGVAGGDYPYVRALALDASGNLYAGGNFTKAGNGIDNNTDNVTVNGLAKWNGTSWSAVGSGVGGKHPYVSALAFDTAGNLYAGGNFITAGNGTDNVTVNGLAKWDGTSWSILGSGLEGAASSPFESPHLAVVSALAFDVEGNLYAGGIFMKAGDVRTYSIARWDGSSWSALGQGLGLFIGPWWFITTPQVIALAVGPSGDLYAGGAYIKTAGGVAVNNIAGWNGSSWAALGTGIGEPRLGVMALAVDPRGNLYAGGQFSTAGGVAANHIAKWDGSSWSPLGSGTGGTYPAVNALAVDASGNLYAGGDFTEVGGKASYYIAKCILPQDNSTSTTTTTIGCPATQVLGADNPDLESLRHFRDSTLANSLWGVKLIEIYYNNAGGINTALERSPVLREYACRLLETLAPMMKR
jgi:hypothetical protein